MKKLLLLISLMLVSFVGYSQYPIKTIFKGDSVIILTIEQSEKINAMIEKNSKSIKEVNKKNKEYEQEIEKINKKIVEQQNYIDSIVCLSAKQVEVKQEYPEVMDSLWKWALGPTLIYTEFPDDSTIYIMDLSQYYMTTDDFGIVMVKMSEREYKEYQEFVKTYGLNELGVWRFRSDMKIKPMSEGDMEKRRVWKFKGDFNKNKK